MLSVQPGRRSGRELRQKLLRRYRGHPDRVPRKLNWLPLNSPDLRLAREPMEQKDRMDAASAHPHLAAEPRASQALSEPASRCRFFLPAALVPVLLFQSEQLALAIPLCAAVREPRVAFPLPVLH